MKIFYIILMFLLINPSLFSQIKIDVSTDKQTYQYRDSVYINVTVTNMGEQTIDLQWGSSCQASYLVIDEYNWINDHACLAILTSLTLEPMQSHTWSFTYHDKVLQVGRHKIVGEILGYGKSDTIEIEIIDTVIAHYVAYYSATVKDSAGHGIVGVLVSAEGADSTFTDPTGRFLLQFSSLTFPPGPPIAYPLIRYSHPDYEDYSEYIMISEGDSITGSDVILKPKVTGMFTISGHVKYDNNEPIPDINVYFYGVNNSRWYYTSTNSEGNYSIQINPGSYYIYAWVDYHIGNAWTFRHWYYNNKQNLQDADLLEVNNNINNINFTFPILQQGTISGKVKDAETQAPLSNVFISVSTQEPGDSSFIGTDQNGNYSIQVFEGDYILFAYDDGYYQQFYKDAYNTFDAIPVTVGPDSLNVTGIDFNLTKPEPGTNIISGFVRDKSTNTELYGVEVFAIPISGENWIESKTGYDGKFILRDIKNGDYILLFYKENYVSQFYKNYYETCNEWEDAFIFSLHGGENINNIFTYIESMNPFGGEISGKISSGSGSSLSGTLISAVDSLGNIISSSISVYNGNYSIPSLRNGNYTIKASKIGYKTSDYSEKIQIDLINNPVVDGVNISISLTGVEKYENIIPEFFALHQNYPNPFNPTTEIKYAVREVGLVTLKVYDVLGREVTALVNEEKPSGTYTINFDASNLSSGVYFYSMIAGSYHLTKKMILAK